MTIIASNAPEMIIKYMDDKLCEVRNRNGNGYETTLAELNRRYPGLKKLDYTTIRIAVSEISNINKWGPI